MRKGFLAPLLLVAGVAVLLVVLLNLYMVQPRLALKLETPEPLPTIEQMPSPPPGKQVETTMNLIKKMAAEKRDEKRVFIPRQVLRNPFLDSEKALASDAGEVAERKSFTAGEEEFRPKVQMVMIGEYLKSALLDGALVVEGDMFKGYRIDRITEDGVCLQRFEETVNLPLGAYTTVALKTLGEKKNTRPEKNNLAPVKQKSTLNELLRRLEPLLDQNEERVKSDN